MERVCELLEGLQGRHRGSALDLPKIAAIEARECGKGLLGEASLLPIPANDLADSSGGRGQRDVVSSNLRPSATCYGHQERCLSRRAIAGLVRDP